MKINYGECELIAVQMEDSNVTLLANVFDCKVGKLHLKYIGLPLPGSAKEKRMGFCCGAYR